MLIIKGYGVVGKSTERFLRFHTSYSQIEFDDPLLGISSKNIAAANWCVICVPSPLINGWNDDSRVFAAIQSAEQESFTGNYLVRSTLSIKSVEKLENLLGNRLIVWPEFIRANHWEKDSVDPPIVVLGGSQAERFESKFDLLTRTRVYLTGTREAMLLKLAANSFLSMKVVFANQLKQLCDHYTADYQTVINMLADDGRFGSSHWNVPGPDGSLGFGGHCFPKDSTTYKNELQNAGIDANMLEQMLIINHKLRGDLQ